MTDKVYYKIFVAATSPQTLKKNRTLNAVSVALKVLAAVALILSFTKNLWFLAGAAALFVLGVTLRQIFLESVASYVYTLVGDEFSVSKITMLGTEKLLINGKLSDVSEFSDSVNFCKTDDVFTVKATDKSEFSQISFNLGGKVVRVLFSPDDYMTALIKKQMTRRSNDLS